MDEDDRALVRASQDPVLFGDLVARFGPALHAYLSRRAPGWADDLLAEVWLNAYASRQGFDPARGSARAWLFGVARNTLFEHFRASKRRTGSPGAGDRQVLDVWDAVDRRLDAVAAGPALRAALSRLSQVDREVLLLVAWEGLTPSEAAHAVGVPAGTARSRLHRARGAMRRDLEAVNPTPWICPEATLRSES